MISKEEAKKKIKRLIDLYEKYQSTGQIDRFRGKEGNTKSTFIEPFFEALGWDIKNQEDIEMLKEEPILKGAVDYAFLIKGQYKFFVEAKPIGRDLKDVKSLKEAAEQSIRYGVNSNNKYVVLTNFEWLVIFNCELKGQLWEKWLFEPMNYKDYLEKFEKIWSLSKEGALKNELDALAGSIGKRVPRTPVDEELLQKFLKWREKLSKDLKKYSEEEIDEFVQKLLARLLFIRNCEDRGFETVHTLWSASQFYQIHKRGLLKFLRGIFKYYDIYNGSIFKESEIDSIEFNEGILAEIINGLYVSEDEVKYDFNIIPSDVMGNLYEQYLGHILKKTPQRAKLKEGKAHRKEQGIYYTPAYIVDYIVKNTLGEILKGKKVDASKIRVLDPACGSGSFLVKAFDVLNEHYSKDKTYGHGQQTLAGYSIKEKILKNNIFGVDLDKQAVEIAQLNLLLKIAEKGQKLPLLQQNIRIGNSLIDDPTVAGDKAFKWEEQFKEIMQEGGFDVVVGNPPYGAELSTIEREFIAKTYETAISYKNTALVFIEKAVKLLKHGGYLGLIVPKSLAYSQAWKSCRDFIQEDLIILVDVSKAFEDVLLEQVIFVIKKECKSKSYTVENIDTNKKFIVKKEMVNKIDAFIVHDNVTDFEVFKKLSLIQTSLKDLSKTCRGLPFQKFVSKIKSSYKVFRGVNISRYNLSDSLDFLQNVDSKNPKINLLLKPKIVSQRIIAHVTKPQPHIIIMSTLDKKGTLNLDTIENTILTNKEYKLETILAVLDSNLISWYTYRYIFAKAIRTMDFDDYYIGKIPIPSVSDKHQTKFLALVDKMLSLNKRLNKIGDRKTDERARIEEEIKKIDAEIDELVYKIYGITEKEKKVIEESLK